MNPPDPRSVVRAAVERQAQYENEKPVHEARLVSKRRLREAFESVLSLPRSDSPHELSNRLFLLSIELHQAGYAQCLSEINIGDQSAGDFVAGLLAVLCGRTDCDTPGDDVVAILEEAKNGWGELWSILQAGVHLVCERLFPRLQLLEQMPVAGSRTPKWDSDTRTLYWNGTPLKKFRRNPGNNQIELLEAFEKEGWRECIPGPPQLIRENRLRQTVKDLNKSISRGPLRFHLDGTGEGVLWAVTH